MRSLVTDIASEFSRENLSSLHLWQFVDVTKFKETGKEDMGRISAKNMDIEFVVELFTSANGMHCSEDYSRSKNIENGLGILSWKYSSCRSR